ncbi:MAG: HlyC/CorC family transporter [candidate division Zixibacteria bacterium]|nr:HlyC/CorC family transporter [candidate division Zixibacteria bacterium]
MEPKDGAEPPSRDDQRSGLIHSLKNFLKQFSPESDSRLSPSQRDAFIEKSIEEFSSQLSTEDDLLEESAKDMIHGIVDLAQTTVKEIMVPRVDMVGIEEGTPIRDVIELVKKHGHSRFPFFGESLDEIKGVLYIKDIFIDSVTDPNELVDTKARPPFFVPETKNVSELLKEMRKQKVHLAIVVDEYGGTAGLVTLEDILEEIVGEIEDEYDLDDPIIKKIDETHFTVKGSLPISELNEELDLALPEDKFETVGGVIYDIVGGLPDQGVTVDYQCLKFTAIKIIGQRITRVGVELSPEHKKGEQLI